MCVPLYCLVFFSSSFSCSASLYASASVDFTLRAWGWLGTGGRWIHLCFFFGFFFLVSFLSPFQEFGTWQQTPTRLEIRGRKTRKRTTKHTNHYSLYSPDEIDTLFLCRDEGHTADDRGGLGGLNVHGTAVFMVLCFLFFAQKLAVMATHLLILGFCYDWWWLMNKKQTGFFFFFLFFSWRREGKEEKAGKY